MPSSDHEARGAPVRHTETSTAHIRCTSLLYANFVLPWIQTNHEAQLNNDPAESQPPEYSPLKNPRKRPRSNPVAIPPEDAQDASQSGTTPANDNDPSEHKRSRPLEWPLATIEDQNGKFPKQEKSPTKHCSPRTKGKAGKHDRPSKFLEGSMNDRVSNKPPSIYIRDDDAMEGQDMESYAKRPLHPGSVAGGRPAADDAGLELPKPSGVYRFGRALVNAFKPIHVWRGFGHSRDEKEPTLTPEKSIFQERQLKAQKAYAELKKNGYKGTQPSSFTVENLALPAIRAKSAIDESSHNHPHRDSGVDVDGYRSSVEPERNGQVLEPAKTPKNPPSAPAGRQLASPMSNASSARKPSLHFRKPSFQNLKKVKSQIHIPAAKKTVSAEPGALEEKVMVQQDLRKQPSRKDIAKQEKLSKRVSDLEAQLEVARRNLKISMQEIPVDSGIQSFKGPRAFKPGALPSLPSERLLNKDSISNEGDDAVRAQSKAAVGSFSERLAVLKAVDDYDKTSQVQSASQLKRELISSFNPQGMGKKRNRESRRDQDILANAETMDVGSTGSAVVKGDRPTRKLRSSSKMQESIHNSTEAPEILEEGNVPPPPRNSPNKVFETVPPRRTRLTFLDPSQVDQAKLSAMRSSGDMGTPLDRNPEGLANLRKDFPTVPEDRSALHVSNLLKKSKITDHTSFAHHDQTVPPVLARPRSASPFKNEPRRAPKHRRSALETSHNNSKVPSHSHAKNMHVMEGVGSGAGDLLKTPIQPPISHVAPIPGDKKVENDKPLPSIQKEDYEWPEDVF
jgi:hypothetical protein